MFDRTRAEAIIAAPFVKRDALAGLVEILPDEVRLTCVTRWWPRDVFFGVTDLEVMDLIAERPRSSLLIHPALHAKYFRGDQRAFVGSANVTKQGLGWTIVPSLELLIETDPSAAPIPEFEIQLLNTCVHADDELRAAVDVSVRELLEAGYEPPPSDAASGLDEASIEPARWVPLCPAPDRLYNVYADVNKWELVTSAEEDARRDLAVLGIPGGLDRNRFRRYVAAVLDQMPLINKIDRQAATGFSDESAQQLLSQEAHLTWDAARHWRILKDWLLHFFPGRYRRRPAQEELVRGARLSKFAPNS